MTDVTTFQPRRPVTPPPDRWQVLADMAHAMDGGRPGGATDLDYLEEALRAFPMPAEHMAIADFEGYAVHRLLNVLRNRYLRRALRAVRNQHGDC